METVLNRSSDAGSLAHILRGFAISLLISFLGMLVASKFLPPAALSILVIVELVMIVASIVIRLRGKNIGYGFVYTFTAISGATLYPVIKTYGSLIGANLVTAGFLVTSIMFGGLSLYAYLSKRNFSFLGGYLAAATIGLVIFSLIGMFIHFGSMANLIFSGAGILIFSGWIVYDIAQYKDGVSPEEVPLAVLNLYLNFINLFLYILRFIASIVGNRN